MIQKNGKGLLNDPQVVKEINKHKWIESEKAGYDIGFERAAEDWIEQYSNDWFEKNRHKVRNGKKTPQTRKRNKLK